MGSIELISDRIRLRPISKHDLEPIHELHSFPETDEFNTLGIPKNINIKPRYLSLYLTNIPVKI